MSAYAHTRRVTHGQATRTHQRTFREVPIRGINKDLDEHLISPCCSLILFPFLTNFSVVDPLLPPITMPMATLATPQSICIWTFNGKMPMFSAIKALFAVLCVVLALIAVLCVVPFLTKSCVVNSLLPPVTTPTATLATPKSIFIWTSNGNMSMFSAIKTLFAVLCVVLALIAPFTFVFKVSEQNDRGCQLWWLLK